MLKGAVVDEGQYVALMRWKVALQTEYLSRRSLAIDVKVLLHTVLAILDRAPDIELERLVARASVFEGSSLPQLIRQRADRIWGPGAGVGASVAGAERRI